MSALKPIEAPPEGRSIIVQLYIRGEPVLRAGSGSLYHADVLREALKEFGILFDETEGLKKIPLPRGEHYKLAGAGKCLRQGNNLNFWGKSVDYGIEIDEEHLELCKKELGDFKFHRFVPDD